MPALFLRSNQLNKFYDLSTPPMRKLDNRGGETGKKKENNDINSGHYVDVVVCGPHNGDRLQCRYSCQYNYTSIYLILVLFCFFEQV